MSFWNIFDKTWESLQKVGTSFKDRASSVVDFWSAGSEGNTDAMWESLKKFGGSTVDMGVGALGAVTGLPVVHQALEGYNWVRAHAIIRPTTSLMLMGGRADIAANGWDYITSGENWRKAWNDTQFVTPGQTATWYGTYLFMDEAEADKLDPGTFSGRQFYTGKLESAIRATAHDVNMFDESGPADRAAYEAYIREISDNPAAMDKYQANTWGKYASGTLDFAAAFVDIPFIGWGAKLTKSGKLGNVIGRAGSPQAAEAFLGRSDEVLSRLNREADNAAEAGAMAERIQAAIAKGDPDADTSGVLASAVNREAADLAELSPMAQRLYQAAKDKSASTFQRLAVSNNSHGGMISSVMSTLAKHGQVHNFADFYAAVNGDAMAWERLQKNAPDVAVAIGRSQNTYNITATTSRYGLSTFANDVANAMRDTQWDAHVDSLARVDGVWGQVVGSQVNQPLIRLRAGARAAQKIHQFALSQPPVITTSRSSRIQRWAGQKARDLARVGPSFGYARDVNLNDVESFRDFRANLERSGDLLKPEELESWVSKYMAQPGATQRGQMVAHVEDMLYRRMGERLGLGADEIKEIMHAITVKRGIAQGLIHASRAYAPTEFRQKADLAARQGRAEDAARLHEMAQAYEVAVKKGQLAGWIRKTLDDQGNLVIVEENVRHAIFDADTPLLSSQNADFLPMTDWRMLRDAAKRYIMPKARIGAAKAAKESGKETGTFSASAEKVDPSDRAAVLKYEASQSALGFMEAVNRTWSTLAVLRPAHAPRAMADDMLSRMVIHGEWQVFASAWRGLPRWGRNRKRTTQLRAEAWKAEQVRKKATGSRALLDVEEVAPVGATVPGQKRGRGRPKTINRFDGMAIPFDAARELAGRYQWAPGRQDFNANAPALTFDGVTTFSTYEEALAAGQLTIPQFLGAVIRGYKDGNLPADYTQILDTVGGNAKGRPDAYRHVVEFALDRMGMSAYTNPKFSTDIFTALFDMHHGRGSSQMGDRTQLIADPLTGVYATPDKKLFNDYETAGFVDIKPDTDFARIASEEARLAKAAKAKSAGLPIADTKHFDRATRVAERASAVLQKTSADTHAAQGAVDAANTALASATSTPARRKATVALRRANAALDRARAKEATADGKYTEAIGRRDQAQADYDAMTAEGQAARAAELWTANRAAMSDAHQEVGNIGYAYSFAETQKLVEQYMPQIVTDGAKLGFTLRPTGEIRVSVLTPAGGDVAPVKMETAEKQLQEWASRLEDSGNTGFRIKQGEHTVEIEGGFVGPAGEGARGTVAQRSPDETWAARQFTKAADRQIAAAISRGAWKPTILPTDPEYGPAWERAVNQELANDAVAKKFLSGWSEARVLDWVENSPEGRKWLDSNTMDRAYHWEQVAAIGRFADELVPPELRAKVLGQSATHGDLVRLMPSPDDRPSVHGESLTMATGTNPALRWVKSGVDTWFKWMVNKPSDKLVRFPFFAESYGRHINAVAKTYLRQLKPGQTWSQEQIEKLQQIARDKAMFDVRRYMYDTAFRADSANALSKFMPFANAQANAIYKWARLLKDNPVQTMSVASRWWLMPDRLGLIEDQDGNRLMYEPGGSKWFDPVTGKEVTGENVGKERYVNFRLPSGIGPEAYNGRLSNIKFNKDSANVFLTWPSAGPWVSIPFNEFVLSTDPTIGDDKFVKRFLLPFGPQSDILKTALPGLVRSAYEQFVKDDTDYAYEVMDYFAQQQVDFNLGRRRERPDIEDAKEMANTMKTIRFWSSALAPVAVQYENPYSTYIEYYKRLIAKHGGDKQKATDEFVANAGEDAVMLTYSVTRNLKGIPATGEAWEKYSEIPDLVAKYPEWAGMLTGAEGASTFSKGVYEAQKRAGMRADFTAEESASEIHRRATWAKYAKVNDFIATKLHERGLWSLNQRGAEDLASLKRQWVNNSKYWYGINGEVELSPWWKDYYERSTKTMERLTSAVQMVQDPRLQGRDEVRGLVDYLAMRQTYTRYLRANGFASLDTREAQPVKLSWEQKLDELTDRNLSFATLHSYYLEADNLSFDINFAELMKGGK